MPCPMKSIVFLTWFKDKSLTSIILLSSDAVTGLSWNRALQALDGGGSGFGTVMEGPQVARVIAFLSLDSFIFCLMTDDARISEPRGSSSTIP